MALVFGKYEKIRRLAQGGMGEVFLARQTGVLDRLAILKALRADLVKEQEFVEQFLDEARVAATLNHPNIVAIYDVGEWNSTYYIAMEYIAGEDLSKVWYAAAKAGIGLPFQVSVRIIHEAALGLDHAHRAKDVRGRPLNIVHRDVSPQNIMVRVDGVTKLVDFGIAKAANKSSRTQAGMVKGKLQYMSPEQVRGEQLDGRSDQFSLGIVLWEMCTGRRLFKADTEINTLQKILHNPIPKPTQYVPGFPPELESVILRMLERDPARRFNNVGEVAQKLKEYLDRSAVQSGESGVAAFVQQILGRELEERTRDLTPMEATETGVEMPVPSPRKTAQASAAPASSVPAPAAQRKGAEPAPARPADDDDKDFATVVVAPEARPDRGERGGEKPMKATSRGKVTDEIETRSGEGEDILASLPAGPQGEWVVRKADGAVVHFHEWATVQQFVLDGRLAPNDQISPDGRSFARLADDASLAQFFATAALARPGARAATSDAPLGPTNDDAVTEPPRTTASPTNPRTPIVDETLPGDDAIPDFFGDAGDAVRAAAGDDPLAAAPTSAFSLGALPQQQTGQWQIGAGEGQRALNDPALLPATTTQVPRPAPRKTPAALWAGVGLLGLLAVTGVALRVLAPDALRSVTGAPLADADTTATTTTTTATTTATTTPTNGTMPSTADAGPPAATVADAGVVASKPVDARIDATTPVTPKPTDAGGATAKPTPTAGVAPPVVVPAAVAPAAVAPAAVAPPVVETYESALAKGQKAQRVGRTKEAVAMFKLALEKQPDDIAATLGLAWASIDQKRFAAAESGFGDVLAREPTNAEAQFGLGEALRGAGRTADAVAAFQRYLEIAPGGPDAETAKNAINALQ